MAIIPTARRCGGAFSGGPGAGRDPPHWHWRDRREPSVFALQRPVLFVDHSVMRATDQGEVGQRRRSAFDPPDQVMPIAPDRRPGAARKDTVPVPRFERPPRRRRDRPAGVAELMLQLAPARDPDDRRVAGVALHRLGRHGPAALELARRRPGQPGQGVEAGADDQLRPRAGTVPLAAGALPAEFDQRVVLALAVAARVILVGFMKACNAVRRVAPPSASSSPSSRSRPSTGSPRCR